MLKESIICPLCKGEGGYDNKKEWINCEHAECVLGVIDRVLEEDLIVFVTAYSITREYGGPEEGGWWYNRYKMLETYPVKNKISSLMKEELEKQYKNKKRGNIYSVLGGVDIEVIVERRQGDNETKERPVYE